MLRLFILILHNVSSILEDRLQQTYNEVVQGRRPGVCLLPTMVESPEYRTLVRCTYHLELAVKLELVPLGAKLVSAELITPDQYKEIRNPYRECKNRAADLIYIVQVKVQQDPRCYDEFLAALENKYVHVFV